MLISQRFVDLTSHPQPVRQDAQLSRNRYDGFLFRSLAASFRQAQPPTFQIGIGPTTAKDEMCSLHQHRPQIGITLLGDSQLRLALARIAAPRPQPDITADITTFLESALVVDRENESQSDQRSRSPTCCRSAVQDTLAN